MNTIHKAAIQVKKERKKIIDLLLYNFGWKLEIITVIRSLFLNSKVLQVFKIVLFENPYIGKLLIIKKQKIIKRFVVCK